MHLLSGTKGSNLTLSVIKTGIGWHHGSPECWLPNGSNLLLPGWRDIHLSPPNRRQERFARRQPRWLRPPGFLFSSGCERSPAYRGFCCPRRSATFGGWIKTSPCLLAPAALWRSVRFGRLWRSLATLLVIWVLSWLALPPVLKWLLQKQASALLGREVTVERVDFRPWNLTLTLESLRVADAQGVGEQLSVKRFCIDAELPSLLRLALVVDATTVEQPRLVLRQLGAGRYDRGNVLQRLAQPKAVEPDNPARFALFGMMGPEKVPHASGWRLQVEALLSGRNGVIDLNLPISDSLNDPQFRLGPVVVRLVLNLIGKAITAPISTLTGAEDGSSG